MIRSVYAILLILLAVFLTIVFIGIGIRFAETAVPFVLVGLVVVALSIVVKSFEGNGMKVQYRDDKDDEEEKPKSPPRGP